jgi:hypothetical protein
MIRRDDEMTFQNATGIGCRKLKSIFSVAEIIHSKMVRYSKYLTYYFASRLLLGSRINFQRFVNASKGIPEGPSLSLKELFRLIFEFVVQACRRVIKITRGVLRPQNELDGTSLVFGR